MPLNSAGETLVSGMIAKERHQEIISNNLANVNTTGFKRDQVSFGTVLDAAAVSRQVNERVQGRRFPEGVYYGGVFADVPVKVENLYTHQAAGNTVFTDNALDVVMQEDVFLAVKTAQGERYTKAGNLKLGHDGTLVSSEGHPVLGLLGPMQIDGNEVHILESGEVQVDGHVVDTLRQVTADDLRQFLKEGDGLFRYMGSKEGLRQALSSQVLSGYVERSNVNPVSELNAMTLNMRAFEAETRAFRDIGRTIERAINVVGRA